MLHDRDQASQRLRGRGASSGVDRRPLADERINAAVHGAIEHLENGRIADALFAVGALAAREEENPGRANLIGLICLSGRDNGAALAWFDRAVLLNPAYANAWCNRAAALHQLGRADALSSYDEALRLGLEEPTLYYNRGNLLRAAGRFDEAIASYNAALRLNPAYAEAMRAGALAMRDLGHKEGALAFLAEATRLRPDFTDALTDRGDLLQSLDRMEEAIVCYDRVLQIEPENVGALNNRGAAFLSLARYEEAGAALDAALLADPNSSQSWNNRGNLLLTLLRPEAALAAYERALALRPDYVEALTGRGVAQRHLGHFDEALADFDAALVLDPDSDHIKNNKAVLLLICGDFEQGFELYESRWIASRTPKHALKSPIPEWNGQALAGKSVVVFDEQGFGDAIQFARFCFDLMDRGADVTFFCRKRLHRLFAGLTRPVRLVDDIKQGERFDYQVALCSLPRALRMRPAAIPAPTPYLVAEAALAATCAARLGPDGFKVGICWRGSANPKADRGRAVPLAAFAQLAAEGVRLISLQKPDDLPEVERAACSWFERMGADFDAGADGFVDAAALMQNLDLIVTCDTSIAHLAGALGRPVLVLLQRVPDWRWLLEREDCPWYPSMRLLRQSRAGDWDGPIRAAVDALRRF